MLKVKCVGCGQLKRDSIRHPGLPEVVYTCSRFPYWCALSGLLRPSKAIEKAAAECPVDVKRCVVCGHGDKGLLTYGANDSVHICPVHDKAWGKWLDDRPEKREAMSPHGRTRLAEWVEALREFIAEEQGGSEALNGR